MGGLAFSSSPYRLSTPRMPRNVYQAVRERCHTALRQLYVCVATPIEGPEKANFGDVDILVALERRSVFPRPHDDHRPKSNRELLEDIVRLLGAGHVIFQPGSRSMNITIPWPEDLPQVQHDAEPDPHLFLPDSCHIQVDVSVCPDLDSLYAHLFKTAHGDLWNLLSSTIRPFGLTIDESAMWIRIPDIEALDKKKARVLLTKDPVEMLHFLGMSVGDKWDQPFPTAEDMFDYVATCRFFWVKDDATEDSVTDSDKMTEKDAENGYQEDEVGMAGGAEGRRKLKANDRKRMNHRPIFRQWIEEYIPRCRAGGCGRVQDPSLTVEQIRDSVRADAFRRFPAVELEWNERLREWQRQRNSIEVVQAIKDAVPLVGADGQEMDPSFRGCTISALRKTIMEDNDSYGVPAPMHLRDRYGVYDVQAVRQFVTENWEVVSKITWAKQSEKANEARRLKELKRAAA